MDQELHGPPGQEVGSEERPAKARRRRFLDQVWAVSGGVVQFEGRHPAAPAGGALAVEHDRLRHVTKAVPSLQGATEPVGLLVVHEEALVEEAGVPEGLGWDEGAGERGGVEIVAADGSCGALWAARRDVSAGPPGALRPPWGGAGKQGVVLVED